VNYGCRTGHAGHNLVLDAVLRAVVSAFFLAAALYPGCDPFLRDDPDPRTGPAVLFSLVVALIYGVLAMKGFYRTLVTAV
jgi:hypothetical protein